MHPNLDFRQRSSAANLAFARKRGFGVLAVNGGQGPLLAQVPFLLNSAGDEVRFHLLRSNPIARLLEQALPALLAVSGPDGYVSPDWYESEGQVPTWNYVAVHVRGPLERLSDDELPDLVAALSSEHEARLAPKPAWTVRKLEGGVFERMLRALVAVRLSVVTVDGTWKLSQNKSNAARLGAAAAVAGGHGQELGALAELMREPPLAPP